MEQNERIARSFYEAANQRDFKAMLELIDERCKVIDFPQGKREEGKTAIQRDYEGWFTAFPDARLQVTNIILAGDDVVVEYTGRGTHDGPFGVGAEAIPATGRKAELPCCDILRFKDGKIVSVKSYYDLAGMFRQLGAYVQLPGAKEKPYEVRPQ